MSNTKPELVEKAAAAIYERLHGESPGWEALRPVWREVWLDDARAALEAVADDLRAEAWEQGWEAAVEQAPGDVWFDEWHYQTNPYRHEA